MNPMRPLTCTAAIVAWMFAAGIVEAADAPRIVELWPAGKVPEEPGTIGEEFTRPSPALGRKDVEVTESTTLVTNVTKPTLTIYRPQKDKETGTAVLICPGGGYWNLYWQLEG